MKLAITGKGGVGKTTIAVILARYLADQNEDVVLIDADPDANAAMALGLETDEAPPPIIELEDLIKERTGAGEGIVQYFSLNPKVDDIPERYSAEVDGVRLLRMGRLIQGGTGCMCPENAFIRSLLTHLVFQKKQTVILDMEAGVEHLGRGTAQGVDMMFVVVNQGRRSIQTAHDIHDLAGDIGVKNVEVVINQYRSEDKLEIIEKQLSPLPIAGRISYDETVAATDLEGGCPYTGSAHQIEWAREILARIPAPAV
ncbi:MAG: AAA family ATPase [Planctomycetes bacterium]|nr:AAA family ATPase [Planctomycetota bacterium]